MRYKSHCHLSFELESHRDAVKSQKLTGFDNCHFGWLRDVLKYQLVHCFTKMALTLCPSVGFGKSALTVLKDETRLEENLGYRHSRHGSKSGDMDLVDNKGIGVIAFCIRNGEGNLVFAKAKGIGETSNVEAEITTIVEALTYCQVQNIKGLTIETDSLVSQKMIQDQWKIPWELVEKVKNI
ncbi:hypothetical protein FXO38_01257 [Capsicum annuum]|nr:hypothetical protein FXO38_01257 [Capsicum annuum]KAF3684738.1 hypothetical protein FXO37_01203 [Capsicum annuum]